MNARIHRSTLVFKVYVYIPCASYSRTVIISNRHTARDSAAFLKPTLYDKHAYIIYNKKTNIRYTFLFDNNKKTLCVLVGIYVKCIAYLALNAAIACCIIGKSIVLRCIRAFINHINVNLR